MRRHLVLYGLLLLVALAGCDDGQPAAAPAPLPPQAIEATTIIIDGKPSDWPVGQLVAADDEYLYVRIDLPDERTLQNSSVPVTLELDVDGDMRTGTADDAPDARCSSRRSRDGCCCGGSSFTSNVIIPPILTDPQ